MTRVLMIDIPRNVRRALLEMAKQDIRAPHEQVRYLIVEEAIRRGLLSQATSSTTETENDVGQVRQDISANAVLHRDTTNHLEGGS